MKSWESAGAFGATVSIAILLLSPLPATAAVPAPTTPTVAISAQGAAPDGEDGHIDKGRPGHFKHRPTRTSSTKTTNFKDELTSCGASGPGIGCTLSRSVSADVSIGLTMGMSRSWIAAQLGITASSSITYTVSCNTTAALKHGQRLYAYPYGSRYTYRIDRYVVKNKILSSRTASAFVPQKGQVTCRIG